MKTRKLLLSALLTLGIVCCTSCVILAEGHREPADDGSSRRFHDKPFKNDIQHRNNRAISTISSSEGKTPSLQTPLKVMQGKQKSESTPPKPRKVKNVTIAAGVCTSIDIRNDIYFFQMLKGCRIIEGFLQILLIDKNIDNDFQNISFPELREITEFLLIYHVKNLKSLKRLFPNLEVIRGDTLITDYALAIYEVTDLQEVGLTKLTQISRGGVRIEFNYNLCYAETVDWNAIVVEGDIYVKTNAKKEICEAKKCPDNCPGNHCWTAKDCQKTDKPICHPLCLVDCTGPTDKDCYVCKSFRHEDRCIERCPGHLNSYRSRRCVTEEECFKMPIRPSPNKSSKIKKWRPLNGQCINECPKGYMDSMDTQNRTICLSCNGTCQKNATGAIIRYISDLESFRGATVIQGALEIVIRNSYPNMMREFTAAFGMVEEITSFLKITHSFPLTSLEFFQSLRIIRGTKVDINNSSLVIVDNPNLSKLFPKLTQLQILNGRLFFHYNPRLCMREITNLANMVNITNITELEVQPASNGDKVACDIVNINMSVVKKNSTSVTLCWNVYKPSDDQDLINYIVSYIETDNVNVSVETNACGPNDWQVVDVGVPSANSSSPFITMDIVGLKPYTSYAVYVKTLALRKSNSLTSPTGQSKTMLVRTAPDIPSIVVNLVGDAMSDQEVLLKWSPPEQPNGPIAYYIVRGYRREEDSKILQERNYCANPSTKEGSVIDKTEWKISYITLIDDPVTCCKKADKISKEFEIFCLDDMALGYKPQNRLNYCTQPSHTEFDGISAAGHYDTKTKLINNAYESFMFNVSAAEFEGEFSIKPLQHFSEYTISVAACGPTLENATEMCSAIHYVHVRTNLNKTADYITGVRVHVTNNTFATISWSPMLRPNGLVVNYDIQYANLMVEDASNTSVCLPQTNVRKKRDAFSIRDLSPGRYRARVRAVTLAGDGPWSEVVEFSVGLTEDYSMMIMLSVTFGLLIVFFVASYCYYIRTKRIKERERLIASVNPDYIETKYVKDSWEVERDCVELIEKLGLGNFGMVYRGLLNGTTQVAVKTLSNEYSELEKNDFLNEASVMKTFSSYHIVQLLGVVSEGRPPYVIMELMEFGDLKTYLRRIRDVTPLPNLSQIIRMAGEIADGMAYLESKKFIHRDLAARNCMVSKDLVCKIGDFGMARDIYETDYYKIGQNGLLPIRWMAPENLSDGIFTPDSDVWSFGIVLYEILTMGELPYQGFSNDEVLHHVLHKGTVTIPRPSAEIIVKLMEKCFRWRPYERPTFIEIVAELEPFLAQDFCEKSFYHSEEGVQIRNSGIKKPYHHPANIRFHWGNETARWVRGFEDNVTLISQTRTSNNRGKIFKNGFQHLGHLPSLEDVPLDDK